MTALVGITLPSRSIESMPSLAPSLQTSVCRVTQSAPGVPGDALPGGVISAKLKHV
jgi:hypothetical protein